ncbi:6-bladed beta-propeller protein [Belliella buryatensis]|uniref:6-bladed beta-propeller protein n=1 Tax=Belliella buryatensis TaxID=1500549 RepID=A0A239DQJ3_9BACT|nr:6-bladed beta-propeller [Belliella buryatensis]SNS34003.1 6-bladed beta-propeller protein [Belliella buryatensis]
MKKTLIPLLIGLNSCNLNTEPEIHKSIYIDVNQASSGVLSEVYEDIDYVFLDGSGDFPLVRPVRIKVDEGLIGVEDRGIEKYIFYSLDGTPQFQIEASGDGPGSFVRTEDFQILEESIVVKDSYLGKMLTYNHRGGFVSEQKSVVKNSDFFIGEDFILHYSKNVFDHGLFNFYLERSNELEKMMPVEPTGEDVAFADKDGFRKHVWTNQVLFKIPFSYHFAMFEPDGKVKDIYEIDFGEFSLSVKDRNTMTQEQVNQLLLDGKIVEHISSFYAFKNCYFLSFGRGIRESHQVFLDKDFNVIKHFKSYKNDIDELPIATIPWFATVDQIGYLASSRDFLNQYLKKFGGGKEPVKGSNLYNFMVRNGGKLNEDSYVLILLTVKDDIGS